jgi:two-component system NarL family response regulator
MGISVFVIDAERTFTDALAARLEAENDLSVVASLNLTAPTASLITGLRADVVILDADLPANAAVRFCEELSGRDDTPRVIMLSHSSEAKQIAESVRAGAAAWVCKSQPLEHLLHVIRGVAEGEIWLPPAQTGAVLRLLLAEREQQQETDRLLEALTPREREVLACIAEGVGRRDVAARLHLSANTVRTHLQNLMAKLHVHSALEAVALIRPHLDSAPPDPGAR